MDERSVSKSRINTRYLYLNSSFAFTNLELTNATNHPRTPSTSFEKKSPTNNTSWISIAVFSK